jgi:hypothetical protein
MLNKSFEVVFNQKSEGCVKLSLTDHSHFIGHLMTLYQLERSFSFKGDGGCLCTMKREVVMGKDHGPLEGLSSVFTWKDQGKPQKH